MSANKGITHNIPLLRQALAVLQRNNRRECNECARAKGCRAESIRYAIKAARKAGRLTL